MFIGNSLPLSPPSSRTLLFIAVSSHPPTPFLAGRIFHAYAKKTHAENVCTRTRSTRLPRWRFLAPLYPSFSPLYVSPFASLFLDNSIPSSPSPPLSLTRSLSHAHAQVSSFFLLSLFSRGVTSSLHPSLTPTSPLRLFARTRDEEIVKPVLHYSTWRDSMRILAILTNCKIISLLES